MHNKQSSFISIINTGCLLGHMIQNKPIKLLEESYQHARKLAVECSTCMQVCYQPKVLMKAFPT